MPQEMPEWYGREARAAMGCDGTDPNDPDGKHRCCTEPTLVILFDFLGDKKKNIDPGTDVPILACSQAHVDEKMGWLTDDHLVENIRVVPIATWLDEVPGPKLN